MDGQSEKFSEVVQTIGLLSQLMKSNNKVKDLELRILHLENANIDLLSDRDKLKCENCKLIKESLRSQDHQSLHKALTKVSNQKETLTNLNLAYSRVCDERDNLKRRFVKLDLTKSNKANYFKKGINDGS